MHGAGLIKQRSARESRQVVGFETELRADRPARRAAGSGSCVLPLQQRPTAALPLQLGLLAQPPPEHHMQHARQRRHVPIPLPLKHRARQAGFRRVALLRERPLRGQQQCRPMPLPLPLMPLQLPSVQGWRPAQAWGRALARGPPVVGQAVPLLWQLPPAADLSSSLAAALPSAASFLGFQALLSASTPGCSSSADQSSLCEPGAAAAPRVDSAAERKPAAAATAPTAATTAAARSGGANIAGRQWGVRWRGGASRVGQGWTAG